MMTHAALNAASTVSSYRRDFPILDQLVNDKPLIYLDSAATSQKPIAVLDAMEQYYRYDNANVHRGIHTLGERATTAYEDARAQTAAFLHAPSIFEIIFTRNTTESINLVAQTWGRANLRPGDVVLLTEMEHHSNLVPWLMLRDQLGFTIRYIPVLDDGSLDLNHADRLMQGVKLVSMVHVSNMVGTINPVATISEWAHRVGAVVLVDGAQATLHMPVNVQTLGCDFYAFSGHKTCGPTGIGVLWGRQELLEAMPPFLGGGDMIAEVYYDKVTFADLPNKFEAGTPSIAQAVGLNAALRYLQTIGLEPIAAYDDYLTRYALNQLTTIPGLRIMGGRESRSGLIAFTLDGIHPHDLATILDSAGIAIRAGHHCVQPLHRKWGLSATSRASFAFYNLPQEIDALVNVLYEAKAMFEYVSAHS